MPLNENIKKDLFFECFCCVRYPQINCYYLLNLFSKRRCRMQLEKIYFSFFWVCFSCHTKFLMKAKEKIVSCFFTAYIWIKSLWKKVSVFSVKKLYKIAVIFLSHNLNGYTKYSALFPFLIKMYELEKLFCTSNNRNSWMDLLTFLYQNV